MKTLKRKFTALRAALRRKRTALIMGELIAFPKDSMGFHLGCLLFNNSYEQDPVPEIEDVYRLLISHEVSNKEEVAMHYYLFGNGDVSLKTLLVVASGAMFMPHYLSYFRNRYRGGRQALRFYDLDHFRMLHLPIKRIKVTFLIH